MQKKWIGLSLAAAAVVAAAGIARAEVMADAIPADFLLNFAPLAVQLVQAQIQNPPVKVDPQVDKASGYHVQQLAGVLVFPDKNLTARSIEEAKDKEVPAGLLMTRALSVRDKDALVGVDKLAVADFQGTVKLPVFFLSVKADGDNRMLEVYSKDGKPVLSLLLKKKADVPADDSALGVKLSNIDLEKKSLDATLTLSGGYQSTVKMGYVEL